MVHLAKSIQYNDIRLVSTLPYLLNTAAKAPNDAHHDAGPLA